MSHVSRVPVNVPMWGNYDTLLQNYAHISLRSGTHKPTLAAISPLGLTLFLAVSIFSPLIEIFSAQDSKAPAISLVKLLSRNDLDLSDPDINHLKLSTDAQMISSYEQAENVSMKRLA